MAIEIASWLVTTYTFPYYILREYIFFCILSMRSGESGCIDALCAFGEEFPIWVCKSNKNKEKKPTTEPPNRMKWIMFDCNDKVNSISRSDAHRRTKLAIIYIIECQPIWL